MEKIKKVFSPGSSKDDQVMYGSEASRLQNAADNEAKKDTSTLYNVHEQQGEKEKGGVLRQILNPGGHKYDEQAYGTNATTVPPTGAESTTAASSATTHSHPPLHDNSTSLDARLAEDVKGIVGGHKHDHEKVGPGQTEGLADNRTETQAAQDQSGAHGAGRDAGEGHQASRVHDNDPDKGPTILAATGTASQRRPLGDSIAGSGGLAREGIAAGDHASGTARTGGITDSADTTFSRSQPTAAAHADPNTGNTPGLAVAGARTAAHGTSDSHTTSSALPGTTTQPSAGSTSLAAAGARAAALGTSPSHNNSSAFSSSATHPTSASPVGPEAGIAGGLVAAGSGVAPSAASHSQNSSALPSSVSQPTSHSHLGRDAGIAGGLVAAGAGAAASTASHSHDNSSTLPSSTTQPHSSQALPVSAGAAHINPVGAPESGLATSAAASGPVAELGSSHAGVLGSSDRSTGIASGGVRNDQGTTQLNTAPADVQGATFLDRSFYMGQPGDPASHVTDTSGLGTTGAAGVGLGTVGAGTALGGHDSSLATGRGSVGSIQTPTNTTHRLSASEPHGAVAGIGSDPSSTSTSHGARDVTVAGGATGLAAGAGATYLATRDNNEPTTHSAYGAEDPNKHNKLHKASPDDKKLEKEQAKEEKHHQKELEKQQHELQKQQEREEKERRHAAEKAEKKHEKEMEKEKKPGLLDRILHRHKDDETKQDGGATVLKENTDNGPLDHPLITAAGTTTTVGAAGAGTAAAYENRASAVPHSTGTTTGVGSTATTSVLTGQRQHDVEPQLSGNNNAIGGSTTSHSAGTTAAVGAGALAAGGAGAAYASTRDSPSTTTTTTTGTGVNEITGQRQHDVEPFVTGNANKLGGTMTSTSTSSAAAPVLGGAAAGGAGAAVLASTRDTSSATPGTGVNEITGQLQHDVEPFTSGNNNAIGSTSTSSKDHTAALGAGAAGVGAVGAATYASTREEPTSLTGHGPGGFTGQPQNNFEAVVSGNKNVDGAPTATSSSNNTTAALGAGTAGVGATGEGAGALSSTLGATHSSVAEKVAGTVTGSSREPETGFTGRRQDDVEPYISEGGFRTSDSK